MGRASLHPSRKNSSRRPLLRAAYVFTVRFEAALENVFSIACANCPMATSAAGASRTISNAYSAGLVPLPHSTASPASSLAFPRKLVRQRFHRRLAVALVRDTARRLMLTAVLGNLAVEFIAQNRELLRENPAAFVQFRNPGKKLNHQKR